jgi:hypothetical protein
MPPQPLWTEEEDELLRGLLDHTLPGGLNREEPPLDFPDIVLAMSREARVGGLSSRVYTEQSIRLRYYRHIRPNFETGKDKAATEFRYASLASERAEKAAINSTRADSLAVDLAKQARLAAEMAHERAGVAADVAAKATEIASEAASYAAKEAKNALLVATVRAERAINRAKIAVDEAKESS